MKEYRLYIHTTGSRNTVCFTSKSDTDAMDKSFHELSSGFEDHRDFVDYGNSVISAELIRDEPSEQRVVSVGCFVFSSNPVTPTDSEFVFLHS